MGTAAAVGGPPLAIAYQRRPGPQLRSTLAATFVLGSTISLLALGIAGKVRADHLLLALELLPALAAGLFVSTRLRALLDRAWLRPTVLAFAALAGAAAVLRGLL